MISRNYNTMARLASESFRELISDYPYMIEYFKKHVYTYLDSRKKFIYKCLHKIEYLKGMSVPLFHDILFNLEFVHLEPDEILLKEGDDTEFLGIVESGEIEVFTEFE